MKTLNDDALRYEVEVWARAAARSYAHWFQTPLIVAAEPALFFEALDEAPFALLVHHGGDDPVFEYGNRRARSLFGYTLEELRALPSRLSAEKDLREERAEMLRKAKEQGYFTGYEGVRIAKTGERFRILDATIWEVRDERGEPIGQAARIDRTKPVA